MGSQSREGSMAKAEEEMRRARAHFRVIEETPKAVLIRDIGPWNLHPTVTNDAEAVVDYLLPLLKGRRLFYFDSEGDLDELLVRDGKFSGFANATGVPL